MSRPPQVRVRFFPPMIPDLAGSGRRIYSLVSVPHRASPSPAGSPHSTAYYPLLVHRHGILPRPSFGPHLAVGTLVSANGSCGQARKGLSPSRFAPCWAHKECGPGRQPGPCLDQKSLGRMAGSLLCSMDWTWVLILTISLMGSPVSAAICESERSCSRSYRMPSRSSYLMPISDSSV